MDGVSGHILIVGDVANMLGVSAQTLDLACEGARVSRTVLRSEILRALHSEPLDVIVTASAAPLLAGADFLAAFAARSAPVVLLVAVHPPVTARTVAGVRVLHVAPPTDAATLRGHVDAALRAARAAAPTIRPPEPEPRLSGDSAPPRAADLAPDSVAQVVPDAAPDMAPDTAPDMPADAALGMAPDTALDMAPDTGPDMAADSVAQRAADADPDLFARPATDSVALLASELASELAPELAPELAFQRTSDVAAELAPPLMIETAAHDPPGRDLAADVTTVEPVKRGDETMANITKTLEEAMKIDGAIGVALADWDSGLCLGTAGGGSRLNVEVAAAGNCQVVKAKMATMNELGIKGAIHDILITLDDQVHLIRPLRRDESLFLYLAIDKTKGNLGMARHRVQKLESELNI